MGNYANVVSLGSNSIHSASSPWRLWVSVNFVEVSVCVGPPSPPIVVWVWGAFVGTSGHLAGRP